MSFLVGKNWVDKCCNERGITVVASVSETEESGEEAGDDEDGEQDDEGGGEGWGGHTDVALEQELSYYPGWRESPRSAGAGVGAKCV